MDAVQLYCRSNQNWKTYITDHSCSASQTQLSTEYSIQYTTLVKYRYADLGQAAMYNMVTAAPD